MTACAIIIHKTGMIKSLPVGPEVNPLKNKIIIFSAALTIFLGGSYAEARFHITPAVTAAFRTGKWLLGDLYTGLMARIPNEIDTTSAFIALAGLVVLLSFRYLARARRM